MKKTSLVVLSLVAAISTASALPTGKVTVKLNKNCSAKSLEVYSNVFGMGLMPGGKYEVGPEITRIDVFFVEMEDKKSGIFYRYGRYSAAPGSVFTQNFNFPHVREAQVIVECPHGIEKPAKITINVVGF